MESISPNSPDNRDTVLASGGGGMWFPAHLGVAEFLREQCVKIRAIVGASGGAVIGAALAASLTDHGTIRSDRLKFLINAALNIRTIADLTDQKDGKIIFALPRILRSGGIEDYLSMMRGAISVTFAAQVAKQTRQGTEREIFLQANPGDNMQHVLQKAMASAANNPMFGIDPVEVDGQEYFDDLSIATTSVHPCVKHLREMFGEQYRVIGTALSFKDSSPLLRKFMDWLHPETADCGDVVIYPKEGHQLIDGMRSLTNWGKGPPILGLGQRYARTEEDLDQQRWKLRLFQRIPIPIGDFIAAGYEAAERAFAGKRLH